MWHSQKEMNGSTDSGNMATYPGSGYYQDLATTRARTSDMIQELKENRWIDRGTRVVYLDFTIYNPNVNLFCVSRYVIYQHKVAMT